MKITQKGSKTTTNIISAISALTALIFLTKPTKQQMLNQNTSPICIMMDFHKVCTYCHNGYPNSNGTCSAFNKTNNPNCINSGWKDETRCDQCAVGYAYDVETFKCIKMPQLIKNCSWPIRLTHKDYDPTTKKVKDVEEFFCTGCLYGFPSVDLTTCIPWSKYTDGQLNYCFEGYRPHPQESALVCKTCERGYRATERGLKCASLPGYDGCWYVDQFQNCKFCRYDLGWHASSIKVKNVSCARVVGKASLGEGLDGGSKSQEGGGDGGAGLEQKEKQEL